MASLRLYNIADGGFFKILTNKAQCAEFFIFRQKFILPLKSTYPVTYYQSI